MITSLSSTPASQLRIKTHARLWAIKSRRRIFMVSPFAGGKRQDESREGRVAAFRVCVCNSGEGIECDQDQLEKAGLQRREPRDNSDTVQPSIRTDESTRCGYWRGRASSHSSCRGHGCAVRKPDLVYIRGESRLGAMQALGQMVMAPPRGWICRLR
ncbi:hypothetical protein MRB53_041995 [Persea americana]|nr:hypothetical protein MRB53_041995 [Persea americana]